MVANKPDLSECGELNLKVYTLHKHTGWGYGKIVSELGLSKSQVRDVVKRSDERGGDVRDAPHSRRPTKLMK
jgi:transposase